MSVATSTQAVTRYWTVAEIVMQYPQSTEVMVEYGLHCFGCHIGAIESLEEGCIGHGFSEEDITSLVGDINDAIANIPARPQTLVVTKDAALGIQEIAKKEEVDGQNLSVQANKDGSFFMEFREKAEEGGMEFSNDSVPEIKVWASILTLQRIGGSKIDVREGKFKLDIGGC